MYVCTKTFALSDRIRRTCCESFEERVLGFHSRVHPSLWTNNPCIHPIFVQIVNGSHSVRYFRTAFRNFRRHNTRSSLSVRTLLRFRPTKVNCNSFNNFRMFVCWKFGRFSSLLTACRIFASVGNSLFNQIRQPSCYTWYDISFYFEISQSRFFRTLIEFLFFFFMLNIPNPIPFDKIAYAFFFVISGFPTFIFLKTIIIAPLSTICNELKANKSWNKEQ